MSVVCVQLLPEMLDDVAPAFDLRSCAYRIERAKEPSARVVVWRQMLVSASYTLEASYAGFDTGPYAVSCSTHT